jgi:hypothetical protein
MKNRFEDSLDFWQETDKKITVKSLSWLNKEIVLLNSVFEEDKDLHQEGNDWSCHEWLEGYEQRRLWTLLDHKIMKSLIDDTQKGNKKWIIHLLWCESELFCSNVLTSIISL